MTDNRFLWEYDETLGFDGLCGIDEVGVALWPGRYARPVWCCPGGLELPALNDSKR